MGGWVGRGEGGGFSHRHLPKQTQLSCMCVYVKREGGGERKDYGNTSSLARSNGGKHREAGACTTHTIRTQPSASLLLLLPISTGAFIQGGQPKEGSWAQITPRLILTGFALYTKAYKNNEMGFGST